MTIATKPSAATSNAGLRVLLLAARPELERDVRRELPDARVRRGRLDDPAVSSGLRRGAFDVCLVGPDEDDRSGTVRAAAIEAPDLPVIVLLEKDDPDVAELSFGAGAAEVLVGASALPRAIRETIRLHARHAGERRLLARLQSLARVAHALETPSLDSALEEAVAVVRDVFRADRAFLVGPRDALATEVRIVAEQSRPEYPGSFTRGAGLTPNGDLKRVLDTARTAERPVEWDGPGPLAGWPVEYAIRSQLVVALRPSSGGPWLLGLHQCAEERTWTVVEKDLFAEIGLRFAGAIDGHRLTHNFGEAFRTLSTLLMRPGKERMLLQEALDALRVILQARYGAIGLVDERTGALRDFIVSGLAPENVARIGALPTGKGLLGVAIHENRPLRLKDISADPRAIGFPPNHPVMTTLLALPIPPGGGLRGNFYVSEKLSGDTFTAGDEALAASFCGALSFLLAKRKEETRRREAQDRLAASEERYRSMVEHAPDMIFTCDLEGRFLSVSAAAKKILGFEIDELVGRPFADLGRAKTPVPVVSASGRPERFEMDVAAKDGRRLVLEVNLWKLREGGRWIGLQGVARDVTDRKRMEAQYLQIQRLEAIGRLAAGLAHDFRNMLMAVSAHAELAKESLPAGHGARDEIAGIESAVKKASVLVRQLLTLAREQPVRQEIVSLGALVRSAQVLLLRPILGETISVTLSLADDGTRVLADPSQLEQVLVNLVVNARDAMPEGGTLLIETAPATVAPGEMPGLAPGRYVRLSIADSGCGMSDEVKTRLFEPFFSTKGPEKGTGLGLATSYGIIRQMGGLISVTSEVGAGARFDIHVPAAPPDAETAKLALTERPRPRSPEEP